MSDSTRTEGISDKKELQERIKQVEAENAALKEQHNYYFPFFWYSRDILAISCFDGTLRDVNPAAEELLGYEKDEIVNKSFLQFIHTEDLPGVYESMEIVRNGYPTPGQTLRFIHKDGSVRYFSFKSFPVHGKYIYSIGREITDKVKAEQELRENEIKFRTIFQNAPVGIGFFDECYSWKDINHQYAAILGYTREELMQKSVLDVTHPEDVYLTKNANKEMLYNGVNFFHYEKRYIHKSGAIIWVDVSLQVIRYENGGFRYGIVIIRDNTARKRAESELIFKNHELNTFLYRSSHDLKGPVSTLRGICNLGLKQATDSEALKYFRLACQTIDQFNVILERLLQLGDIKQKTLTPQNICPESFTRKIVEGLVSRYSVRLQYSITDNLDSVYYDSYFLNIILFNLVENTIKFSSQNRLPELAITFDADESGHTILTIKDNGPGIQPELHDKVFNMFTKGYESSRGAGLGLYMVRSAVERMGGCIDVYSYPQAGTTFRIYLPPYNKEE